MSPTSIAEAPSEIARSDDAHPHDPEARGNTAAYDPPNLDYFFTANAAGAGERADSLHE